MTDLISRSDEKDEARHRKNVNFNFSEIEIKAVSANSSVGSEGISAADTEKKTALEIQDSKEQNKRKDQCREAINIFPYFKNWDINVLEEGYILSKIEKFTPEQIILGQDKGEQSYVYFILRGQCEMIQHLKVTVRKKSRHNHFRLASEEVPLGSNEHLATYFMQICIMNKGETFGIGENLKDRSIIALTEVECLLCPRHWLWKNNKANIWKRIEHFLNLHLPTCDQVFREFVDQRKWLSYRGNLVRDVLRNNNLSNDTVINDVPYSIRIRNDPKQ